jgi:DNA-binding response OmpR family regulator
MNRHNHPHPSKTSILVVDDCLPILEIINLFLQIAGYQVYRAETGAEALQQAIVNQPDLILLDTHLPDVCGYDLCHTLKTISDTRHIPVVFMTLGIEFFDRRRAANAGGVDYLIKPFDDKELYTCIKTHVNRPYLWEPIRNSSNFSHLSKETLPDYRLCW